MYQETGPERTYYRGGSQSRASTDAHQLLINGLPDISRTGRGKVRRQVRVQSVLVIKVWHRDPYFSRLS